MPGMPYLPFLPRLIFLAGILASAGAVAAGGASNVSTPVPLDPLHPNRHQVGRLEFRGGLSLAPGAADIGGLSALAVLEDGHQFIAISDVGRVVSGRMVFDAAGRLRGVTDLASKPLPDTSGQPVQGRRRDSEGLARLPGGGWVVSFEREHRLMRYPPGLGRSDGLPTPIPLPPGLDKAPDNGGIESVTVLADGRLLAIEEGDDPENVNHRAWVGGLGAKSGWARLTYRSARSFRPTDATTLPSGDVVVLERYASWFGGVAARLALVPASAIIAGAVLEGEELARLEPPMSVDNFEGIAAVPGRSGETLIYLVSDDNFSPLQRTLLLQFALPASAPSTYQGAQSP